MDQHLAYFNGDFLPLDEVRIPVLDRGFLFGDGVYEVIPVYQRRPFHAARHLARLERSLDAISIPNPHAQDAWMALLMRIMQAHLSADQLLYIQVTRGVAARMHAFPPDATPTVFIMTSAFTPPAPALRANGVDCVSMEDQRWLRCDIKSTSLLGNVLAAQHAASQHALEAIQFRDGFLTEGSASNVWVAHQGRLSGPPRDHLILEGIRYGLMEELCQSAGIPFSARRISRDEVFAADEILLSSASKEILPVARIDGRSIGQGKPGPIFRQLYQAYEAAKSGAPG